MALSYDIGALEARLVKAALAALGLTPSDATVASIVGILMGLTIAGLVMGLIAPMFVWIMRKIMAHMQARQGPMRVGPHGILQPLADGIKLFAKEDIMPARADPMTFRMAPYIMFVPAVLAFAPLPFGNGIVISDLRVGILFILAIGSISPLGEILAGWGSNNKFALYGGLRAAALDVAYEIPMVLAAVAVIVMAGSMSVVDIVDAQDALWFVVLQPLGFFIFFVAGLARIGVVPMDLPEAESELVAGYFTEYSGMRFGVFFVGVFVNIVFVSMMTVLLFFGGWHLPFVDDLVTGLLGASYWTPIVLGIIGLVAFLGKTTFFVLFVLLTWFTLPRLRIDQFLAVSWKGLFPLAVLSLVIAVAEAYVLTGGF